MSTIEAERDHYRDVYHKTVRELRDAKVQIAALHELRESVELEVQDLQVGINLGTNYQGASKHSLEWHAGWEACAKATLKELQLALDEAGDA